MPQRLLVRPLRIVAVALAFAAAPVPAAHAAGGPAAPVVQEQVYGVVVAQGQQLGDALAQLTLARPELTPRIIQTLDSGTVAGGAAVAQALRTGAPIAPAPSVSIQGAISAPAVVALSTTPHFEGALTLTGFDCTSKGCVPVALLTHNAQFDLGYTTYMVTGKTSGSRTNWGGISASGFCYIGVHASCSGTGIYPSGASWVQKILSFSGSMGGKTARILTTFTGAWRGSPGSLSGYTPYFTCSSSTRQCKFTV